MNSPKPVTRERNVPSDNIATICADLFQSIFLFPDHPSKLCSAITYEFKPDAFPSIQGKKHQPEGRRQHGFIAQEVEALAPGVVFEDSQGIKAVAYARLVPTMAAALSEALNRIDTLEALFQAGAATVPHDSATASSTKIAKKNSDVTLRRLGDGVNHKSVENDLKHIPDLERAESVHEENGIPETRHLTNILRTRPDASGKARERRGGSHRGIEGHASSTRLQRRAAALGARDQEGKTQVGFDQVQLSMENTALRGKIYEMEKKLLAFERKLATLVG